MGLFGWSTVVDVREQVQREREILPDITKPLNKFLVSRNCTGSKVVIIRPPREMISVSDALLLAALLVEAADATPGLDAFKSVLQSVRDQGSLHPTDRETYATDLR